MAVDVYFSQLKHQNVKQLQAYQITQFLGNLYILYTLFSLKEFYFYNDVTYDVTNAIGTTHR